MHLVVVVVMVIGNQKAMFVAGYNNGLQKAIFLAGYNNGFAMVKQMLVKWL